MLLFVLGVIIGLLIAVLVFTILAFFRAAIEKRVKVVEKVLHNAGPRPRGFIFEPEDEVDEARQEIIERNKRAGRDTEISELL